MAVPDGVQELNVVGAMSSAIERLAQSLERGFESLRYSLKLSESNRASDSIASITAAETIDPSLSSVAAASAIGVHAMSGGPAIAAARVIATTDGVNIKKEMENLVEEAVAAARVKTGAEEAIRRRLDQFQEQKQ